MENEIYKQALLREYLFAFEYLLYSLLFIFSRDELHKWLAHLCGFLLIFYVFIGRHFEFKSSDYIATFIYLSLLILFFVKVAIPRIRKKSFTYSPVILLLFFIISFLVGSKAGVFNLPWITGYIMSIISFIIGFIMIMKKIKDNKRLNQE